MKGSTVWALLECCTLASFPIIRTTTDQFNIHQVSQSRADPCTAQQTFCFSCLWAACGLCVCGGVMKQRHPCCSLVQWHFYSHPDTGPNHCAKIQLQFPFCTPASHLTLSIEKIRPNGGHQYFKQGRCCKDSLNPKTWTLHKHAECKYLSIQTTIINTQCVCFY